MKPAPFAYHDPRTVDEALSLLGCYGDEAKVLAGGQSLMPVLNFRLSVPSVLIDINRVSELAYIRHQPGQLRIGAVTRQRQIEFSELVSQHAPLLHRATRLIGHLPIRTRGTIGGSMVHADPAAEYPTVAVALGAEFVVRGPRGSRVVAAEDFFVGYLSTALMPDELLLEVRFPTVCSSYGQAFVEFARRHGDFALVGIAALLEVRDDRCRSARLATAGLGLTTGPAPGGRADAHPRRAERGQPPGGGHAGGRTGRAGQRPARLGRVPASPDPGTQSAGDPTGCGLPPGVRAMTDRRSVQLTINGVTYSGHVEPRTLLVDFLRHDLGLTGSHVGCEHGVCGACTILVNGEAVRSCLMLAVQADGARLLTVEGLAQDGQLHPLQDAFREHHGLQCGFCTPGMLLTAYDLLQTHPTPSEQDIRAGLSAVLCRCTGYQGIVEAVQAAAKRLKASTT